VSEGLLRGGRIEMAHTRWRNAAEDDELEDRVSSLAPQETPPPRVLAGAVSRGAYAYRNITGTDMYNKLDC